MVKSGYSYISDTWHKNERKITYESDNWNRLVQYRKEGVITRIDKPTKLHRARMLGYQA
ncbi:MAG: ribosomal protein L15E [Promethearchaeota archaeon CR_4]|nr:MAG: ribosomal protein L15E [Candidatus Lokiarchaeota archaeon CR_4]